MNLMKSYEDALATARRPFCQVNRVGISAQLIHTRLARGKYSITNVMRTSQLSASRDAVIHYAVVWVVDNAEGRVNFDEVSIGRRLRHHFDDEQMSEFCLRRPGRSNDRRCGGRSGMS